jgi:hypothetical protein
MTANYLMGNGSSKKINVVDEKTLAQIKDIFRQLCFLNGINPEIMAGTGVASILG